MQAEAPGLAAQSVLSVSATARRLVTLAALVRAQVAASPASCKAVVFLSTCDAVDFVHAGEALLLAHRCALGDELTCVWPLPCSLLRRVGARHRAGVTSSTRRARPQAARRHAPG